MAKPKNCRLEVLSKNGVDWLPVSTPYTRVDAEARLAVLNAESRMLVGIDAWRIAA